MCQVEKCLKNAKIRKLLRNLKQMIIVFNSNHFNTIIYTKLCCVLSFMQNKPSLNVVMRESAKNK